MKRALALSGGGVRGIMSAYWLNTIESYLPAKDGGARINEELEIIAGTSTGAIIGALLATGDYTSTRIFEMYRELCAEVFPSRWFFPLTRKVVRGSIYDPKPLRALLERYLGDAEFGDFSAPELIVCSYEVNSSRVYQFDSRTTPGVRLVDACMASAAAMTFFPMVEIKHGLPIPRMFEDGGLTQNNPSGACFMRGADRIVSLGTGMQETYFTNDQLKRWSGIKRLSRLVPQAMDNAEKTITSFRVRMPDTFVHIDVPLQAGSHKMDDASVGNLERLTYDAQYLVDIETLRGNSSRGEPHSLFHKAATLLG